MPLPSHSDPPSDLSITVGCPGRHATRARRPFDLDHLARALLEVLRQHLQLASSVERYAGTATGTGSTYSTSRTVPVSTCWTGSPAPRPDPGA